MSPYTTVIVQVAEIWIGSFASIGFDRESAYPQKPDILGALASEVFELVHGLGL